ncbi:MAG: tRNA pseudouridine(38-40) synthase TruA [Candidatus Tectomicrobia bacterium RIFCSPLOWO2_12_FULL_69_37]|nr:MAG: tRNA pseudouridine(38-40) synthase TruA [Candidatus Tectomicrobia bacterium RIFCSPLOWO2_12_FULL_69_37]
MPEGGPRRLVVWVEYDGTDFRGWQVQPGARTVQGELEQALSTLCGGAVRVVGSGRTDTGVHALGQAAHFDTRSGLSLLKVRLGVNGLTGPDLAVVDCREASPGFHAQHDALGKTYRYRILNRRSPSPLRRSRAWHLRAPLDVERMARAASFLVGEHDFAAFCREQGRPASTVRCLERLEVGREGDEIVIEAAGNGFLRHMVRTVAGTLAQVGRGERAPGSLKEVLASRDRTQAGPTAPPQGLFLVRVDYGPKTPSPGPPEPEEETLDAG